ncbi:MAG TPA: hypothetical protein DD400_00825, partial [Rhodospirillaceae bacterium]|nr:hypothetical protein [Rhodospirillaceae bacterium]
VAVDEARLSGKALEIQISKLEKQMKVAAGELEFETAARLRDEIRRLEAQELGV